MNTDRELLELAAKAAGLTVDLYSKCSLYIYTDTLGKWWSPLMDDGDALRLAVRLRLVIHVWDDERTVSVAKTLPDGQDPEDRSTAWHPADTHECGGSGAATRRAISSAAAEIGRAMP